MTPTNELRWVERLGPVTERAGPYKYVKTVHVLQQKWLNEYTYPDERTTHIESEWRDVPVEKETQP